MFSPSLSCISIANDPSVFVSLITSFTPPVTVTVVPGFAAPATLILVLFTKLLSSGDAIVTFNNSDDADADGLFALIDFSGSYFFA